MLRFIASRILQFPFILAVIYLITYLLAWVVPGTPFEGEKKIDPVVKHRLQTQFHADKPVQFLIYYPWKMIRHGDLGPSLLNQQFSVNEIIGAALPVSVTLGIVAVGIAVFVGVGIGTLAAVKRGGVFDWLSLSVALVGISLPSFVAAGLLVALFATKLHWFPYGGWGSPRDIVLPSIALSLVPMAYIARLTRVSMIDVLGSDYVRTARAKGLTKRAVVWKHCLRNAFLPVLSYLGPAAAYTLTGSFVVEKVFTIPGLGQHFVDSIRNRDQTLILGTVMVYSFFLLTLNLVVDVLYAFVDPRIDVTAKGS